MATVSTMPEALSGNGAVKQMCRFTREKRQLWYQLTVLQQPLRARACGSGMKANSDRRPVDPPPVIELRIIEGPSIAEGKDITFDYNANFFLYASLEKAREIAPGRLPNAVANNPPILTGVPASGMAYLDRPSEAGYFIFPDLSVRHEGHFVLNFSLFETTKEEKDFDLNPAESDLPPGVDWRMEIKTEAFHVYSAKKFPGLMESTMLSKTVADQGCRVRIRRDVRMRKRDSPKSGGGNGGNGNRYDRREEELAKHKRATPAPEDPHSIRARSHSNSSDMRLPQNPHVAQPLPPQRRPSAAEAYPPPPPPYEAAAARSHLTFGDSAQSQYQTPRSYNHHMTHSTPYPPPPPQSPYVNSEMHSQPNSYHSRANSSTCPSPALSIKQDPYEQKYSGYVPASPSSYSGQSRRGSYAPPPLAPAPLKNEPSRGAMKIASLVTPPLSSPLPPIEAQTEVLPPPLAVATGGKRKHEVVFTQNSQPLYNGQRQQDAYYRRGRRLLPSYDNCHGRYARADGQACLVPFNTYQQ